VAVSVTDVLVDTGVVVMVKVAEVELAGTVTLAGTCATEVLLLDKVTTAPPAGAGPVRVTVPVVELPPTNEPPALETELRVAAFTDMLADWEVP
jgi:hypothetical protein